MSCLSFDSLRRNKAFLNESDANAPRQVMKTQISLLSQSFFLRDMFVSTAEYTWIWDVFLVVVAFIHIRKTAGARIPTFQICVLVHLQIWDLGFKASSCRG